MTIGSYNITFFSKKRSTHIDKITTKLAVIMGIAAILSLFSITVTTPIAGVFAIVYLISPI